MSDECDGCLGLVPRVQRLEAFMRRVMGAKAAEPPAEPEPQGDQVEGLMAECRRWGIREPTLAALVEGYAGDRAGLVAALEEAAEGAEEEGSLDRRIRRSNMDRIEDT